MLGWIEIVVLYGGTFTLLTWFALRGRKRKDKETKSSGWQPFLALDARLKIAVQKAQESLVRNRTSISHDLFDDWTGKVRAADQEGKSLMERVQILHQASRTTSRDALVLQRAAQNKERRDALIKKIEDVCQALELVPVDLPRYAQMDGRPQTSAAESLRQAMESAHRLEQSWHSRENSSISETSQKQSS